MCLGKAAQVVEHLFSPQHRQEAYDCDAFLEWLKHEHTGMLEWVE
jgi:hypothetical protein